MRWISKLLLAALFSLEVLVSVRATRESLITLNNFGYENIVVGISPDVKEDNADVIIRNLQNLIRDASSMLYRATERKFYFRSIQILLPNTWSQTPAAPSAWETYDTCDIRVAPGNWEYQERPFTVHANGCGRLGEYINLTPDYLLKLNDPKMQRMYGPPDKIFVQEWAKYRYGVFEENGHAFDSKRPNFYKSPQTGEILPNLCVSERPDFTAWDVTTNGSCKIDPITGVYDENCAFELASDFRSDHSLMTYHPHALNALIKFCDDEHHNFAAPTKQNIVCGSRSVWSVLRRHPDFLVPGQPPASIPEPTFALIRSRPMRYVLVMDISGSMDTHNRLNRMIEAVQGWIKHNIPDESYLGLVKFSTGAQITSELMVINGPNRDVLIGRLPRRTEGATCIGCGLREAINVFNNNGESSGGVVILITDGEENERPFMAEVTPDILSAGLRVVSVAFGKAAEQEIEELAYESGGKSYFILDEDQSNQALNDALEGCLTYEPAVPSNSFIVELHDVIYNRSGNSPSRTVQNGFTVDSTVGKNFEFKIIYMPYNSQPFKYLNLRSPSGVVYNNTHLQPGLNEYTLLKLPLAEIGDWSYTIDFYFSQENNKANVLVTAQARDETAPITIECSAEDPNPSFSEGIQLKAEVKKGTYPVIGISKVMAKVTSADTRSFEVPLVDDGSMGDEQANDGTYSKMYTDFVTPGRYTIVCDVHDDGSSYIKDGYVDQSGSNFARFATNATKPGPFNRNRNGGSVQVTSSMALAMKNLPPGRITDLQLVGLDSRRSQFSVQFTAPGAKGYTGTVSSYKMAFSTSYDSFVDTLRNTIKTSTLNSDLTLVTNEMLVSNSSLSPKPVGNMQIVTVEIDRKGASTFYVAVRGVYGVKEGKWSNIVTVNFIDEITSTEEPITTTVTKSTPTTRSTTKPATQSTRSTTTSKATSTFTTSPSSTERHTSTEAGNTLPEWSTTGAAKTTTVNPKKTTTARPTTTTKATTAKSHGIETGAASQLSFHVPLGVLSLCVFLFKHY